MLLLCHTLYFIKISSYIPHHMMFNDVSDTQAKYYHSYDAMTPVRQHLKVCHSLTGPKHLLAWVGTHWQGRNPGGGSVVCVDVLWRAGTSRGHGKTCSHRIPSTRHKTARSDLTNLKPSAVAREKEKHDNRLYSHCESYILSELIQTSEPWYVHIPLCAH